MDEGDLNQFVHNSKFTDEANLAVLIGCRRGPTEKYKYLPQVPKDVEVLNNTFVSLGYDTLILLDKTRKTIVDVVETIARNFSQKCLALVVTFSGHGCGTLLLTEDGNVNLETEIVSPLVSQHPIVPKIFLIDACRGDDEDPGVIYPRKEVIKSYSHSRGETTKNETRLPNEGNYVLAYSTLQGRKSYEEWEYGSWMQLLCDKIKHNTGGKSIFDLLTRVNGDLIQHRNKKEYLQQPIFISCLNVEIYFSQSSTQGRSYICEYDASTESQIPLGAGNTLTYEPQNKSPKSEYEDLAQKIIDLDKEFTSLVLNLVQHALDKKIGASTIKDHLNILPGYLGVSINPLLSQVREKMISEEMRDIFGAMHSHLWNFLDYHLIQYLVSEIGPAELKAEMDSYSKKIESFKENTFVIPFMKCWHGEIKGDIPEYVMVEVKHDITDATLAKLDEFRSRIINTSFRRNKPLISHYATVMYYKTIKEGCLCVYWLLHPHYLSEFINEVHNLRDIFQAYHVKWIKIDGKVIDYEFNKFFREKGK